MYTPRIAIRRRLGNERGGTLLMVVGGMLVFLGATGLALDTGRLYLDKARLARAVDAGALAGARGLRKGQSLARQQALAMAAANGLSPGRGDSVSVAFGTGSAGEATIALTASRTASTTFMRVLGPSRVTVRSRAVAAVRPIDMVLVLDQSNSLTDANAFDDLQRAAKDFVGLFDDRMDRVGLVSFFTWAVDQEKMGHNFTHDIRSEIDEMRTITGTNIGEGLRKALDQMRTTPPRQRALRVVVLFTDGRPTAVRSPWARRDVLVVSGSRVDGYFNERSTAPADGKLPAPDGCANWEWCESRPARYWVEEAWRSGEQRADALRSENIVVYTIGLGDPDNPHEAPDLGYLRRLANEDGAAGAGPRGKMYFAPSAAELEEVFEQVARDIQVRLAQ